MEIAEIKSRLEMSFPESKIQVLDLTGTKDHIEVSIESSAFRGLTRIEQHQAVMKVFATELKSEEIHALSIRSSVPRV